MHQVKHDCARGCLYSTQHPQGCILFHNWWPMLTGVMYVMVPMPYLFFFGNGGDDTYGSTMANG